MKASAKTRPRPAAFASTDCHTCVSRSQRCERQRPYCSTCLGHGLKCGGYATVLSWHECRAYSGDDSRQHRRTRTVQCPTPPLRPFNGTGVTKGTAQDSRGLGFISSRRLRSKETDKRSRVQLTKVVDPQSNGVSEVSTPTDWTNSPEPQQNNDPDLVRPGLANEAQTIATENIDFLRDDFESEGSAESVLGEVLQQLHPMPLPGKTWTPFEVENCEVPDYHDTVLTDVNNDIQAGELDTRTFSPHNFEVDPGMPLSLDWLGTGLDDTQTLSEGLTSTSSVSAYIDWARQQEILKQYDTDLCVLPLTSDMAHNPFRIKGFAPEDSQLLLHSISALASQHQVNTGRGQSSEASLARSQAYDILSRALLSGEIRNKNSCLLAAILILMTLDCTISALGNWSDHIRKALKVLEAWGGPSALNSPRLRSQASMLIWWDATLAIISRRGRRLSSSYFEHLLQYEQQDGWSFYELTGCPTALLVLLVRLADLAAQNEVAEAMEYLKFDMEPVLAIEKQLLDWESEFEEEPKHVYEMIVALEQESDDESSRTQSTDISKDIDGEETYRGQRDQYHCAEAWRYALLLYIRRVFRWKRKSHVRPAAILPLTCKIFEHVRNCRKTSLVQKQLLLPIFLAGAETWDRDTRDTVRAYCLWWCAKSRYGMFYSVSSLLEEYWAEELSNGKEARWWGSFLDVKSNSGKVGELVAMQYLFG